MESLPPTPVPIPHPSRRRGFTLVLTLIVLSAITLLVLGLFANVSSESATANNYDHAFRAQTAVRSGLARVEALLQRGTWSDDYLVLEHLQNPPPSNTTPTDEQWRNRQPVLTLARAKITGDTTLPNGYTATWEYTPLTSGVQPPPPTSGTPSLPTTPLVAREDAQTKKPLEVATALPKRLPWQTSQNTFWEVIYEDRDEDNNPATPSVRVPVARYAFHVEDLQGLLSLDHAGNPGDAVENATGMLSRNHEREKFEVFESLTDARLTSPRLWYAGLAPGLRTPDDDPLTDDRRWVMSQSALYSLLEPTATSDTTQIDNQLMVARHVVKAGSPTQVTSLLMGPDAWKPILMKEDITNAWPTLLQRNNAADAGNDRGRLPAGPGRRLEENTITGLRPYHEMPLIPVEPGVFANPREPKMNLNRVLVGLAEDDVELGVSRIQRANARHEAVNKIAQHIQKALPAFESRGAGLPFWHDNNPVTTANRTLAYLQNLAANMIDYADEDCLPTLDPSASLNDDANLAIAPVDAGNYRGVDSYPLVNEQFVMNRWEGTESAGEKFKLTFSVQFFYEFWNMTNRPVTGFFEAEYSNNARVLIGSGNAQALNEFGKIKPGTYQPLTENGTKWMKLYRDPASAVALNYAVSEITILPNQHLVLGSQPIVFELTGGDAVISPVGPPPELQEDITSHYRIRFRPSSSIQTPKLYSEENAQTGFSDWTIIDRTRARLDRKSRSSTGFQNNINGYVSSATVPGSGYSPSNDTNKFRNNLGDPRAVFHYDRSLVQSASAYSGNTSPGGRNIRRGIQNNFFYREIVPSKWPDRGHDTGASGPATGGEHISPISVAPSFPTGNSRILTMNLATQRISNAGRFFSVSELGHLYDPLFWDPSPNLADNIRTSSASDRGWLIYWDLDNQSQVSTQYAAGGTLRIGRPENSRFRTTSSGGLATNRRWSASALLDIFHCGISTVGSVRNGSQADKNKRDLTGFLTQINGQVNLNTASRDVLRSLCAGNFGPTPTHTSDPVLNAPVRAPRSSATGTEADLVVDSIIRGRPYTSPSQLVEKAVTVSGAPVFGVPESYSGWQSGNMNWHDAGREELFSRVFNSSTVRSRNFRVTVTGQSIRRTRSNPNKLEVLSTRSRCFHVFVQPIRDPNTGFITEQRIVTTHEQDL